MTQPKVPSTLKADFGEDFASSAFGEESGDPAIIGKWGSIVQMDDGSYDCWFRHPDLTTPLSGKRMAKIARECRQEDGFEALNGEGYTQGRDRDFVLRMAVLAGVKKKRKMSAEAKVKAAEALKSARAAQNRSV